jgi:sugar lactone lactonase YvrE
MTGLRSPCLVVVLAIGGCGGHKSSNQQGVDAAAGGGADAGHDAGPTLTIQPASYTVPIGRSQIFVASGATAFSVMEAGGGTVDASGIYTAPLVPGTYHVVASDGVATGIATVTVADFQLTLLTGELGGPGHVDAIGTTARLDAPGGIANDGNGNVYFADQDSETIRKLVIATGAVTTIAGAANQAGDVDGVGSAAQFDEPFGIALDPIAGILYVSEPQTNVIRSVVLATGAVTTIAGKANVTGSTNGVGSAASFAGPNGLTLDGLGNLYVADRNNCLVRYIVLATDTVATLAGTVGTCTAKDGASPTFRDVTGIAYDGGTLYVSDGAAIRHLGRNTATTIAGTVMTDGYSDLPGTSALFDEISAITSDGAGTLYIGDPENSAIRKFVISTTQVTTVAGGTINGTGDLQFDQPYAATDANGTLYVADFDHTIRAVTLAAETVTLAAGLPPHHGALEAAFPAATFFTPAGLAADGHGDVYVIDSSNFAVRTLDLTAGASTLLAGSAGNDGTQDGTGAAARFYQLAGIAIDGTGTLYVDDSYYCSIRQITVPAGVVTTPFSGIETGSNNGTGTASSFDEPEAMVVVNGVLYVADTENREIRAVDLATATTTTFAGNGTAGVTDGVGSAAEFVYPVAITSDNTNLYVYDDGLIRAIAIATRAVTTIAGQRGSTSSTDGIGSAATFDEVVQITWDGGESVYFADASAQVIRRMYLPTAAVNTFAGVAFDNGVLLGSVTQAQLGTPGGIAIPSPGTLALTTATENSILELVQQ